MHPRNRNIRPCTGEMTARYRRLQKDAFQLTVRIAKCRSAHIGKAQLGVYRDTDVQIWRQAWMHVVCVRTCETIMRRRVSGDRARKIAFGVVQVVRRRAPCSQEDAFQPGPQNRLMGRERNGAQQRRRIART